MADAPEEKPGAATFGETLTSVINATLDVVGRPALRDMYNAAVGDRITAWRAENLADVFRAYQEATRDLPPEGRRFVAERVGIRFIEEASLEDDPDLQKIWRTSWPRRLAATDRTSRRGTCRRPRSWSRRRRRY